MTFYFKDARRSIALLVFCLALGPVFSRANDGPNTFTEKVLPAAALVGGIGCAIYQAGSGDYGMAALTLVAGVAMSYTVNTIATWCSKREGPSLAEAIRTPPREANFVSPSQMIEYFERAFKHSTEFAVADAQSFAGNIASGREEEILAKAKVQIFGAKPLKALQDNFTLASSILINRDPEQILKMMKKIAENVVTSKTGICTTFAGLGAHLLTRGGLEKDIRVEVISRSGGARHATTHLFNVVGRAEGSDLSNPTTWGTSARIVDLWYGALGNAFVFDPADAEYQPWLKNLKVVYSNKPDI